MKEEPELRITEDGSHTLYLSSLDEGFHSSKGALTESVHVFIQNGLYARLDEGIIDPVSVFEVGLGTGLNLLLTILACQKKNIALHYTVVEPFPVSNEIIPQLNYGSILKSPDAGHWFSWIHDSPWDKEATKDKITIKKVKLPFQEFQYEERFDVIYFDAFAPEKQPELWSLEIFKKIFNLMNDTGIFVTYSAKGQVRRDLLSAGLLVERLAGAPGKREMIRAIKPPQNS